MGEAGAWNLAIMEILTQAAVEDYDFLRKAKTGGVLCWKNPKKIY